MGQVFKRASCCGQLLVSLVAESAVGFLAVVLGAIDKNHNTFSLWAQDALASKASAARPLPSNVEK
jgi:hypothetical protein